MTRAAERLHLSQPALSASLARLRSHFGDPILARRGNAYELTPFALRLAEHTTTALEAARRVFESQATWEPTESEREFSIFGSDYGFTTIGRVASELAAERAPGVRFRFMLHNPMVVEDAANRLRSVDGMVIPHGFLTGLPYLDLWRDGWVAVVSSSNDAVGEQITMENVAELPWVMSYQSRSAFTSAERQIQQLGIEPRVEVVVESFLSLPHFVVGTNGSDSSRPRWHRLPSSWAGCGSCRCPSTPRRWLMPSGGTPCTTGIPSMSGCAESLAEAAGIVADAAAKEAP